MFEKTIAGARSALFALLIVDDGGVACLLHHRSNRSTRDREPPKDPPLEGFAVRARGTAQGSSLEIRLDRDLRGAMGPRRVVVSSLTFEVGPAGIEPATKRL